MVCILFDDLGGQFCRGVRGVDGVVEEFARGHETGANGEGAEENKGSENDPSEGSHVSYFPLLP